MLRNLLYLRAAVLFHNSEVIANVALYGCKGLVVLDSNLICGRFVWHANKVKAGRGLPARLDDAAGWNYMLELAGTFDEATHGLYSLEAYGFWQVPG